MDNYGPFAGEIHVNIQSVSQSISIVTFFMVNSTVQTERYTDYGVLFEGCCAQVQLTNTSMRFANIRSIGFKQVGAHNMDTHNWIHMDSCQFIGSTGVPSIVYLSQLDETVISNCIFSNNTSDDNDHSVVTVLQAGRTLFHSCTISDNNMTGITLISAAIVNFSGHNVIQNNRNTQGAGITLFMPASIIVQGELLLYNNTADKHGGAILVKQQFFFLLDKVLFCTLSFKEAYSSVTFSGNRAVKGGSDMYGAMGCTVKDAYNMGCRTIVKDAYNTIQVSQV